MNLIHQPYGRETSVALAAVRQAAGVCRQIQRRLMRSQVLHKSDSSPVTVADFASQAMICRMLVEHFPDHMVVGEEGADDLRSPANAALRESVTRVVSEALGEPVSSEQVLAWIDHGSSMPTAAAKRFWTLDPIDGTKGFLRGQQYAVALAYLEAGQVCLGVLGCPNFPLPEGGTGILMAAAHHQGCWQGALAESAGTPLRAVRVAQLESPAEARFCESVESGHSDQEASARIVRTLGITAAPYRMDSQCKYAAIARGDAAIYLRLPTRPDYREKIWDHAAGSILVSEAGGRVSDVRGRRLDFSCGRELKANEGVVATCGPFHEAVVTAIQEGVDRADS